MSIVSESVGAKTRDDSLCFGGASVFEYDDVVTHYDGPNNAGNGRFTNKMALAVASIARGESATEAAGHAGVSRRTVLRWKHRPEFKAAFDRWVGDRALVVDSLRAVLEDPKAHARLKLRAAARLAAVVKDRQAASNRTDDLIARDERIVGAVMLVASGKAGKGA